jgi:hypothetical protein
MNQFKKAALWTQLPSYKPKSLLASRKAVKVVKTRQRANTAKRKPIPRISPKKAKSDRIYNKMAREFMRDWPDNVCHVAWIRDGERKNATSIHHIRGRLKTLKFDKRFWCPTSAENNLWPHLNPEKARELGLLAADGDWNKAPQDAETQRLKNWMIEKGIW